MVPRMQTSTMERRLLDSDLHIAPEKHGVAQNHY
jgi:hypothetical protein